MHAENCKSSEAFSEELPNVRYCGYCQQPYPASNEFFNLHGKGRYGLHTQCKKCQQYYLRVLRQLRSAGATLCTGDTAGATLCKLTPTVACVEFFG